MRLILDSSAVLNNFQSGIDNEIIVPDSIAHELKSDEGKEKLKTLLSLGAELECPSEKFLMRTKDTAESIGELGRLSNADIEVIALALEKKACVVSDDYSIENVCRYAGIDFIPVATDGIKNLFKYTYRCTGCGRYYKKYYEECPVCGSTLRARRV
ncbi:MAG: DNA-binding protein [Candidatus Thermoplasmatota archaeon]|nr:DNA-binding protein [Candidatus Thermoplasmatota archaeon]